VVEVRAEGTLGSLDLEGTPLADTLHHVGLATDGDTVARLMGHSMAECLPFIAAALTRLFHEPV
jgi:hypothetical protein